MSRINYVSTLPTGIKSLLSFGSNFSNLSVNTVDKSSKSSKTKQEDSDISLEVKEDKETKNTNKNKEADKEKVTKAKEDIDKGFDDLVEKEAELCKKYNRSNCLANTQFQRQKVIIDILKDFSVEEMEALIDEYGVEDFAKKILNPLMWQATNEEDQKTLESIRHILDYEMDDSYRDELKKVDSGYNREINGEYEYNRKHGNTTESIMYWL